MDFVVTYIVLKSGVKVERHFDSYYLCKKFVNKLRYSSKCSLISYPTFSE